MLLLSAMIFSAAAAFRFRQLLPFTLPLFRFLRHAGADAAAATSFARLIFSPTAERRRCRLRCHHARRRQLTLPPLPLSPLLMAIDAMLLPLMPSRRHAARLIRRAATPCLLLPPALSTCRFLTLIFLSR